MPEISLDMRKAAASLLGENCFLGNPVFKYVSNPEKTIYHKQSVTFRSMKREYSFYNLYVAPVRDVFPQELVDNVDAILRRNIRISVLPYGGSLDDGLPCVWQSLRYSMDEWINNASIADDTVFLTLSLSAETRGQYKIGIQHFETDEVKRQGMLETYAFNHGGRKLGYDHYYADEPYTQSYCINTQSDLCKLVEDMKNDIVRAIDNLVDYRLKTFFYDFTSKSRCPQWMNDLDNQIRFPQFFPLEQFSVF